MVSLILGGGRMTKDSPIDLSVGIKLHKHLGNRIQKEDTIAILYANDEERLKEAKERFIQAYTISKTNKVSNKIIYEVITKKDL